VGFLHLPYEMYILCQKNQLHTSVDLAESRTCLCDSFHLQGDVK